MPSIHPLPIKHFSKSVQQKMREYIKSLLTFDDKYLAKNSRMLQKKMEEQQKIYNNRKEGSIASNQARMLYSLNKISFSYCELEKGSRELILLSAKIAEGRAKEKAERSAPKRQRIR